jgi:hypothetical protein
VALSWSHSEDGVQVVVLPHGCRGCGGPLHVFELSASGAQAERHGERLSSPAQATFDVGGGASPPVLQLARKPAARGD